MGRGDSVGQPERATQDRVIALFRDELAYRYLGDWSDRSSWRVLTSSMSRLIREGNRTSGSEDMASARNSPSPYFFLPESFSVSHCMTGTRSIESGGWGRYSRISAMDGALMVAGVAPRVRS